MSQSPAVIIGNVVQDPELTFTTGGVSKLGFSVACNYGYTDASGEKVEKVSYFNVVAWRYLADDTANVIEKGMGVIVSGRLEQRSWEDKEGNTRYTTEVIGDNLVLLSRANDQQQGGMGASAGGFNAPASRPAIEEMGGGADDDLPF
jgi:single-strand DNA-binding protein